MTTRIVRTREEEENLHQRFTELFSQIKLVQHDIDCINLLKKVKPAFEYHRLMVKNEGNKHEKPYRSKRYKKEKDCVPAIEYYLKTKQQIQ